MGVDFSGHDECDEAEGTGTWTFTPHRRPTIVEDLAAQRRQCEELGWKTAHCYACKRLLPWRGEKSENPTIARLAIVPHEGLLPGGPFFVLV